jgi:acetyl esterase
MAEAFSREAIMAAKAEALEASRMLDELNKVVPVQGIRESIALPGRTLDAVYYPADGEGAPVVFAFHGGGFVFGGCALDDDLWHAWRQLLRANVVSIGYRKGAENRFPAPLDDAYDAIKYYLTDTSHDFDRSRIAVMGNSAGASESATVSLLANRRREFSIGLQILVYPFLDSATPPQDKSIDPMMAAMYVYFNEAHAREEDWTDPLVSPVFATKQDLVGLPRAVVVLAENDGLYDEGRKYADMMREAGVRVDSMVASGMEHGYLELSHRGLEEDYVPLGIVAAGADGTLATQVGLTMEFIRMHFEDWAGR